MQLYGFAYSGPFGHFLHKLMEKIFKGEKGNDTVAKKVKKKSLIIIFFHFPFKNIWYIS